jgi:hypothetical protein
MGVYLLPKEVHYKMDSARAIISGILDKKKKYHMVKWEELAKPRGHGSTGFTDTRLTNECLLAKWIIKMERAMMICVASC